MTTTTAPADQIDQGCITLIRAELGKRGEAAKETLDQARTAREQAEADLRPIQERIGQLEATITDVQQRIASLDAVIAAGEDVTAEIEARSLRQAMTDVIADRQGRADALRRTTLAQLQQALTTALETEGRAREHLEDLVIAAASPLDGHKPAMETAGYGLWIKHRFAEILNAGDKHSPHWKAAKAELKAVLGKSGVGAEVEERAIQAYRSGDPAAVSVGGTTHHLPSGHTVINEPGRPPIVYDGKATRQDLGR